jgi:homoserine dehydrogenase
MGQVLSRYHISLDVDDKAGVLAAVATAFAEAGVSISTVRQEGRGGGAGVQGDATLVVVTHSAPDAALAGTVDKLAELDSVHQVTSVMRVMGDLR